MEAVIRELFDRYENFFNRSLIDGVDASELSRLYAEEFIGAGPSGVKAGRNDADFGRSMAQSYDYYRRIGTKHMRMTDIRLSRIDEHHSLAHVGWTASYARDDGSLAAIDFDIHYFVQVLNGQAKVFGWVSGDEQALLKQHGIG